MTDTQTEKKGRPGLTLSLLLLMFAVPPLLAWYLLNFTDAGVSSGTVNHGELVHPARTLPEMDLYDAYADLERPFYGKWNMVYFHEGVCEEFCQEKLYRMRQVRLATSKYAHRLQRVIVLNDQDQQQMSDLLKKYQGLLIMNKEEMTEALLSQFPISEEGMLENSGRIYIVDPIGNLMMYYDTDSEPKGMIKDLQRLIKLSRIG